MNKEIVNSGRQKELDWAKAFTIIAMICSHVYEQISVVDTSTVPTGAFRLILEFSVGPLGAPLFMFCMGVGIMYSPKSTPVQMVKRGVLLLRNGYLLSFVKGTIPTAIAIYLGFAVPWSLADSFFLVSILQFAGMAFFTIALMKKLNFSLPAMLITSLVLSVLGGQLAKFDFTDSWVQYLFGLFFNTNDVTTFPLLRWLFYPVFGMIFAYFLQRVEDKGRFYGIMFPIALICTLAFGFIYSAAGMDLRNMFMLSGRVFYHQSLLHHLYATFVILTALPIYYWLSVKVNISIISGVVSYLARNLDVIYLVQWVIIIYAQSFMIMLGVSNLTIPYIIPVGVLVLLLSIGFIELVRLIKRAKKSRI